MTFPDEIFPPDYGGLIRTTPEAFYNNLDQMFVSKSLQGISGLFTWSRTRQGHKFWADCYRSESWEAFLQSEGGKLLQSILDRNDKEFDYTELL
jgi:hypothetical protein